MKRLLPFITVLLLAGFSIGSSLRAEDSWSEPEAETGIAVTWEAQRKALIDKYDANGDGALDATERAAMQQELAALRTAQLAADFAALDTDEDGLLTFEEFAAGSSEGASLERLHAAFLRLDLDQSQTLTFAEFSARPIRPAEGGTTPTPQKPHSRGSNRGASVAMSS